MGGKSNYLELKVLDHVMGQSAYTQPTPYLALFTTAPDDSGGGVEVSGGSYARQDVSTDYSAASNGATSNTGDVAFPQATALWGELEAFAIFDASGAGNMLIWGFLIQSQFAFTSDATSDTFTAPGHTLVNGDVVILEGANLPAGVSAGTRYYVVNMSGDNLQLSLTSGGAAINTTSSGNGNVGRLTPKTIESGDQAIFRTGTLTITED